MTPTPLSDDARQRLASLGYVSAVTPPQDGSAVGADPKRMVAVFEQLLDGNRALASGRANDASRIARAVTQKDPGNAFAQLLLGPRLPGAGSESRGDGGVQGLPHAGTT